MKRFAVIASISVFVLAIAALAILLFRLDSSLGKSYVQAAAAATQATSKLAGLGGELATAQAMSTALSIQLDSTRRDLATKQADLDAAVAMNLCPGPKPVIDYTSNASVSDGLEAWVGETTGSVDNPTWEVIWSNSRTAIHSLPSKYLMVFVVTFDEADPPGVHSVYDIGAQCYLDR